MEDSLFLEEDKNLIDNLNRIDLLIIKLNDKIESYNYELESTSDDKKKQELLEKKFDKVLEVNTLKERKCSPYFGHLILECKGELLDIYVGEKTIFHDGKFIVYDYRNPLCGLFYSDQTSFKYNDDTYKLKLKRKLIIENGKLIKCFEDTSLYENTLLKNRSNNYFKTLSSEQNRIMRLENNKHIFIHGVSGSGKSTFLLHRISCLSYNYPAIKNNNYLYITNDKEKYDDLRRKLDIDNISIMNINEYYLSCLKKMFNVKEFDCIKINIGDTYNKDIIDSEIEMKTLDLIINKFNEDAVDDIKRFEEEFKYDIKEFNNLNVYDKYLELEKIVNDKLNEESDKIKILTNNLSGWLDSIYSEVEVNIGCDDDNKLSLNYYKFNNTSRKDQLINFIDNFDDKIENELANYTNIDETDKNDYIRLTEEMTKNINSVINTLVNNNINIRFEEYNFECIMDTFKTYKNNNIKLLNEYKEQLKVVNNQIDNFKLKIIRSHTYKKLINRKLELEKLIKDLEYNIFILMDIEEKYIVKFEDNYNDILNIENKLDKNYINLLEFKKYFTKVKDFISIIYKYEKYLDLNDNITDKILSIINIFKEKFNNKVHYFNFIYVELFNSICNDINFKNIRKYKTYLNDIKYKHSGKYLLETYNNSSKVVYYRDNDVLDNINIYRLLYVAYITGYYRYFKSDYNFIFIDDVDNYSLLEIELLKNTLVNAYFNITSNNMSTLEKISKIIDGKIYTLSVNYRNTGNVTKYCNEKFGLEIKESNYIGNEVKILKFLSYKDTLNLINSYQDAVLIAEEKYLDYFRNNGVTCFNIDDKLDEYKNVIIFENDNWDNNKKYYLYTRSLNDLVIYNSCDIPDNINDLDII